MGNKINPINFRNKKWNNWNVLSYSKNSIDLHKDVVLKKFLTDFFFLRNFSVSNIYTNYNNNKVTIYLNLYPLSTYFKTNNPFLNISNKYFKLNRKPILNIGFQSSFNSEVGKKRTTFSNFNPDLRLISKIIQKKKLKVFTPEKYFFDSVSTLKKKQFLTLKGSTILFKVKKNPTTFKQLSKGLHLDFISFVQILKRKSLTSNRNTDSFKEFSISSKRTNNFLQFLLLLVSSDNTRSSISYLNNRNRFLFDTKEILRRNLLNYLVNNTFKFNKLQKHSLKNIYTLTKDNTFLNTFEKKSIVPLLHYNVNKYKTLSPLSILNLIEEDFLFKFNIFLKKSEKKVIKKNFHFFIYLLINLKKKKVFLSSNRNTYLYRWRKITRLNELLIGKDNINLFLSNNLIRKKTLFNYYPEHIKKKMSKIFNVNTSNMYGQLNQRILEKSVSKNKNTFKSLSLSNNNWNIILTKGVSFSLKSNLKNFRFKPYYKKNISLAGKISSYQIKKTFLYVNKKNIFSFYLNKPLNIKNLLNKISSIVISNSNLKKNKFFLKNKNFIFSRWIISDSLFLNEKFYYFLILRYNIPYITKVLQKLLQVKGIAWKFFINDKISIGSEDLMFLIKKQLNKRNSQKKLLNPLKLIKDQLDLPGKDDYKAIRTTNLNSLLEYFYNKYMVLQYKLKNKLYLNYNSNLKYNLFYNKKLNSYKAKQSNLIINRISLKKEEKNHLLLNSFKTTTNINYFRFNLKKLNLVRYNNFIHSNIYGIIKESLLKTKHLEINPLTTFSSKSNRIIGYKISGFGRLGSSSKSTRTSVTTFIRGKTTKSSIQTQVDYKNDFQITRNGSYGIKIFKFYKSFNSLKNQYSFLNSYLI